MSLTHRSHENGHTGGGFASKLDVFSTEEGGLPMYKDKPYHYAGSRKYVPYYRRRRAISGAILALIGLAYWFGMFSPSTVKPTPRGPSKSSWGWLGGKQSIDWDERREKVKEAFMLSWDGYEKYAWGTSLALVKAQCPYLGVAKLIVGKATMSIIHYRRVDDK